jgi:hypothetical protein
MYPTNDVQIVGETAAAGDSITATVTRSGTSYALASVTEGTTSGVISSFTDDELTMIDSSKATKALPSALNSSGNGFSVTWEKAS